MESVALGLLHWEVGDVQKHTSQELCPCEMHCRLETLPLQFLGTSNSLCKRSPMLHQWARWSPLSSRYCRWSCSLPLHWHEPFPSLFLLKSNTCINIEPYIKGVSAVLLASKARWTGLLGANLKHLPQSLAWMSNRVWADTWPRSDPIITGLGALRPFTPCGPCSVICNAQWSMFVHVSRVLLPFGSSYSHQHIPADTETESQSCRVTSQGETLCWHLQAMWYMDQSSHGKRSGSKAAPQTCCHLTSTDVAHSWTDSQPLNLEAPSRQSWNHFLQQLITICGITVSTNNLVLWLWPSWIKKDSDDDNWRMMKCKTEGICQRDRNRGKEGKWVTIEWRGTPDLVRNAVITQKIFDSFVLLLGFEHGKMCPLSLAFAFCCLEGLYLIVPVELVAVLPYDLVAIWTHCTGCNIKIATIRPFKGLSILLEHGVTNGFREINRGVTCNRHEQIQIVNVLQCECHHSKIASPNESRLDGSCMILILFGLS